MMGFDDIPEGAWWALTILSITSFVGSLIALDIFIVRMPADYFASKRPPQSHWTDNRPALRVSLLVIKNIIGVALITLGFVMLFIPGQGILCILIGLSLVNLPGKRALERRIVANPVVLRTLNSIRARRGRPPLVSPRQA